MEIRLAKAMGFCRGVARAVKIADKTLDEGNGAGTPVYALGPLIHNPQAIKWFSEKGLTLIDEPEDVEAGIVILRAHGVPSKLRTRIEAAGHSVVDATCPVVLHNLSQIARYSTTHQILIVGYEGHPETLAMRGVEGADGTLVPTRLITEVSEIKDLYPNGAYAVFVQTTFAEKPWQEIQEALSQEAERQESELLFASSICSSSRHRRNSLLELTKECDGILVVGGKNSANTRALYDLAKKSQVKAWHIEDATEVNEEMQSCAILGITAGASTPDEIVQEVIDALRNKER